MIIKWHHFQIVSLVISFVLSANVAVGESDLSSAESVAIDYMAAFYQGDFKKAAQLTHPDTLATLKRTFLAKLERAQTKGQQNALLKKIGVKEDVETLRRMPPQELYVTLVKSNQKRGASDAFKHMSKTKVEILSSELINSNEAAVRLKIENPADTGLDNRAGGLLLRRYKKNWRVRTNLE